MYKNSMIKSSFNWKWQIQYDKKYIIYLAEFVFSQWYIGNIDW